PGPNLPSTPAPTFCCKATITLLPPLPNWTVLPYSDWLTLLRGCLLIMPSTGVPNAFCNALVVLLPHFPSTVRLALVFDVDDFLVEPQDFLFDDLLEPLANPRNTAMPLA